MGSGKSVVADRIAARLRASVIRSDSVRKQLAGLTPETRRMDEWCEGIYSAEFSERTYGKLHERAAEELQAGRPVIIDASYRREAWRDAARELSEPCHAKFIVVEVTCSDAARRDRLRERSGAENEVSDGRIGLLDAQKKAFDSMCNVPAESYIAVDNSGAMDATVQELLDEVYKSLLADGF
jgi:predicted kinase